MAALERILLDGIRRDWVTRQRRVTRRLNELRVRRSPVIEEIDGRRLRRGDQWMVDFASCNYLGLDLDPEIQEALPAYVRAWGTHPSWSRAVGANTLYDRIEQQLADLCGTETTLLLPTLTHIHLGVLPVLAAEGDLFMDVHAHQTLLAGGIAAAAYGANVQRFDLDDMGRLEALLRASRRMPRVICVDGVDSMTGRLAPLAQLTALARAYDAIVYLDDAHGFGILGARDEQEPTPYGIRGNGTALHLGDEPGGRVLTVAGLSKAYSTMGAFVACSGRIRRLLEDVTVPYTYSGPIPVAALAAGIEGLDVNARRGEAIRTVLYHRAARLHDGLRRRRVRPVGPYGHPIISVPLARAGDATGAYELLQDLGFLTTPAIFPVVPRDEAGLRVQMTAANTDQQVDALLTALDRLDEQYPLARVDQVETDRDAGSRTA